MKNFLTAFAVFLIWVLIGYFWLVKSPFTSTKPIDINPIDTIQFPSVGTLKLENYNFPKGIIIHKSNTKITIPQEISSFKDSIFQKLNTNQNTSIEIIGKYTQKIVDSLSTAANGLARADALKKELIAYGINPLKITTSSKESLFKYDSLGNFANGIALNFKKLTDYKPIAEATKKTHLIYYKKGEDIRLDNKTKRYIAELKYFLANNPKAKAQLVVFTDSDGSKEKNYWNALDLAVKFRKQLDKEFGIKKKQLRASSRGELDPLYDNTSVDKAKNNRIEITVK